ncbi:MAG: trypsin-like peptidase domain-containing protein [Clostridia bacterium]|nr:trypsin-like peptidase domain-containing protein [Clostridia bacterium]
MPKPMKNLILAFAFLFVALFSGFLGANFALAGLDNATTNQIANNSTQNEINQAGFLTNKNPLKTDNSEPLTAVQVAAMTANSVVEINTEITASFWGQRYTSQAAGSGVIINTDGYIVTNAHVIEGAQKITVRTTDGTDYSAKLIGRDSQSDLAVLKINGGSFTAATLGNSSQLVLGQEIVVIGNPLGKLGGTVTKGIISALDREITIDNQTMNLLQTDAAINGGNSGGGMFNMYGELVGIVNAKSSGIGIEGLGFAIPIDDAKSVINDLIDNGYVTGRAVIGVTLTQVADSGYYYYYPQQQRYEAGIYVYAVNVPNCPLQEGDMLVTLDGTEIKALSDVSDVLKKHSPGDLIKATVKRDGSTKTLSITLRESTPQ